MHLTELKEETVQGLYDYLKGQNKPGEEFPSLEGFRQNLDSIRTNRMEIPLETSYASGSLLEVRLFISVRGTGTLIRDFKPLEQGTGALEGELYEEIENLDDFIQVLEKGGLVL